MKITTLNKAYILLLLFFALYSCQENNHSTYLLEQAQELVENDPAQALTKLDSILNPEKMDRNEYMQYIVVKVQAKYKIDQDVTGDSLIFEAQRYFENRKNPDQAALAHFYAGVVYHENQISDKTLECFLQAEQHIKVTNNKKMKIRIQQNIGDLYYERDIIDNAITYYHLALENYSDEAIDIHKLQLLDLLGWAYKINNNLDSAASYFSKGLELANQFENKSFQVTFIHNLGVVYRDQKKYKQAIDYLNQALVQTIDAEDQVRVYLNLSITYSKSNQPDSARHYTNLLEDNLSKITDDYVLFSTYKALSDYNQQSGDYKEALHYTNFASAINEKIINTNSSQKLIETSNNYQLSLKDKEIKNQRNQFLIIGFFIILILSLITCFKYKQMRYKHKKERDLLETQNRLLKLDYNSKNQEIDSLIFLQNIYQNILNEWATIESKAEKLVKKYKITEEPSIDQLVKELRSNVKNETNHHLKEWAQNYLQKELMSEKEITALDDDELILLVLSYCRYSKENIATILNIPHRQQNIEDRKSQIKIKLIDVGLSESLTDELLFGNNREHDFQN